MSLRDYEALTTDRRSQLRDPYYLTFQIGTRGAADRALLEPPVVRVDMVYAFNGEYGTNQGGQAEKLWYAIKENYVNGVRLGSYASSPLSEVCPLQAADLFAYELCHEFENRITRADDPMRWGLRQILKMYKVSVPAIRLFDRKELLRVISEGNFPDQTGVRLALYRELSCDESVIQSALGEELVSALAKLANPEKPLLLQASASSFISHRLARLAAPPQPTYRAASMVLSSVFGAVLLWGICGTVAHTACCFFVKR